MHIEWWHWMVLGVGLIVLELIIPAFFVIWFGLGALIVGVALGVIPVMSIEAQIGVWIVASLVFVICWFKIFKAQGHRTRAGLSQGQFTGEVGLTIQPLKPYQKGQIRFQKPILGSDVWEAISDEEIIVGARVNVLAVEGNILRVAKIG
jgi:membrane protein implicated in regulation of membrane protease activity